MMLSRLHWWLLALLGAAGLSVGTALAVGFVPTAADLTDPLGRPAALARSIAGSTAAVDKFAADIHDKHRSLAETTRTLSTIADHLDEVVGQADTLSPLTADAKTHTDGLQSGLKALPPLVAILTGHAKRATDVSDHLGTSVDTVAHRLGDVGDRLSVITGHLGSLAPRAQAIASVLHQLQRDTAPLRPLGPILGRLGPGLGHLEPGPGSVLGSGFGFGFGFGR
jgi:hypothetical protein